MSGERSSSFSSSWGVAFVLRLRFNPCVAIVEAINGKICRTDTMQLVLVRLISARDNYVLGVGDPLVGMN